MAVSLGNDGARNAACGRAFNDVRFRGWFKLLGITFRPNELLGRPRELPGEGGTTGPGAGDDDNDPALNG